MNAHNASLNFTVAEQQFNAVIVLLKAHNQFPPSYAKVVEALSIKLSTLASLERGLAIVQGE